jgi:hypothetical protein
MGGNYKLSNPIKEIIGGIIWIVVACLLFYSSLGNPLEELALIRNAKVAQGFIVDTLEDVEDGDDGSARWFYKIIYTYHLPDGREFTQSTKSISGQLEERLRNLKNPHPIEVEYLPNNPTVSRPKGMGSDNLTDWLWRKAGLGSFLLILFVSPGIVLIFRGVREIILKTKQIP